MHLAKPRKRTAHRISLTPLIDIVFILLLFFILESNFLRFGELGFNTPERDREGRARTTALELQLFGDGRIWVEGRARALDNLDTYLEEKQYAADTPVIVRAQDDLPVQLLVRVVDVLHRHALASLQIMRLQE